MKKTVLVLVLAILACGFAFAGNLNTIAIGANYGYMNSFEDDEYQGECDFIAVELTDELSEALIGKTSSCERDEFLQGVLDYVFGIRKVKYIDYFVLWEVLYIEYKKKL